MTKKIWRVYYDLPNYVNPKEVTKIFKLMRQRDSLMDREEGTISQKRKDEIQNELLPINEDLKMLLNVISPKESNWSVIKHKANGKEFFVITITEPVQASLHTEGQ